MASSSAANNAQEKHDVFLSFRGTDTRRGFTSHLYEALDRIKIQTYIDYKLERGDEIAPALLEAISESKLSVIIFSENYASSRWCLDELVHILKCRASQFVIPVFYNVDPSDIRKQTGSYADAFVEHEKRFKDCKLKAWREALTTAGNISGFESDPKIISSEAELVKLVVDDVKAKLNRKSQIQSLEGLVGMEKHIQDVELLLCLDSRHVQTVGIWGMGGIGKTTIADVVFHRVSSQFEACCFIQNVRERSETKQGLHELRDQMLSTVLKEENVHVASPSIGSTTMRQRLSRTKALVVLDDVSDSNQVEFLVGGEDILFGPGSRIIVTARNKRMLGVDDAMIYKVAQLHDDVALDLFHSSALKNLSPTTNYATLSREVVDYAGGNPLALTVLGAVFSHCRSVEDWKGEVEKLKRYPDRKIQNALRLSYDVLEQNEAEIFLDIACFHRGKHIDEGKRILESSGFSVNPGVRFLMDMSLLFIDKISKTLQMHDLIQEMGRKIVFDQCDKNPGKRSRLWLAHEVGPVLEKNKGTAAIEGIVIDMNDLIRDIHAKYSCFEKMDSLRLLDIHSRYWGVNKVHLPPDFEYLPDTLAYLRWDFYPQLSLPSRFSSEMLVELRMPHSQLKRLWTKDMQIDLGSLKHINLSESKDLAEFPDLFGSPNLESIDLHQCSSLVQLPSSFQHIPKLTHLYLGNCSSLKILPEMPGNLEYLLLMGTAIEELPSSVWSLKKLKYLQTDHCKKLKNLPTGLCSLNSLQSLFLVGCSSLESLPVEFPAGLQKLDLKRCMSVRSLPDRLPAGLKQLILNSKKLTSLHELPAGLQCLRLNNCISLSILPIELPAALQDLDLSYCENLGSLPVELPAGLRVLTLTGCKNLVSLPKLPWLLQRLDAQGCTSLVTVPSSMRAVFSGRYDFSNDEKFDFRNSLKLDHTARNNIMTDAKLRIFLSASPSRCREFVEPISVIWPGNEIPEWMQYQSEEHSINIKLPPHWFRQDFFLGYALCIVFELHNVTSIDDLFNENRKYFHLVCETCHTINNGQVVSSGTTHIYSEHIYPGLPNSDHVFAWYFCPEYVQSYISEVQRGTTISREDWVDASFDFMLHLHSIGQEKIPLDVSNMKLKRCGVSLIYNEDVKLIRDRTTPNGT